MPTETTPRPHRRLRTALRKLTRPHIHAHGHGHSHSTAHTPRGRGRGKSERIFLRRATDLHAAANLTSAYEGDDTSITSAHTASTTCRHLHGDTAVFDADAEANGDATTGITESSLASCGSTAGGKLDTVYLHDVAPKAYDAHAALTDALLHIVRERERERGLERDLEIKAAKEAEACKNGHGEGRGECGRVDRRAGELHVVQARGMGGALRRMTSFLTERGRSSVCGTDGELECVTPPAEPLRKTASFRRRSSKRRVKPVVGDGGVGKEVGVEVSVEVVRENERLRRRVAALEMTELEVEVLREKVRELEWALDVVRDDADRVRDDAWALLMQQEEAA